MTNLSETFADVAALIPRFSWEIMDEEQRDALMANVVLPRYMQTTADGVQLGPTTWAEMVGASPSAIKNRVQRLQASQIPAESEGARAHWTQGSREQRNARAVLRNAPPEQIAELLAEPTVRANVSRALDDHYTERAAESKARERERDVERSGGEEQHAAQARRERVGEIVSVTRGAASGLRFVAHQAQQLELKDDGSGVVDELLSVLDEIDGFVSMLRSYFGAEITADDLARLVGEGA